MSIIEKKGNLLEHLNDKYIAFAISGDYTLGAGLAKKINEANNLSYKLHLHYDNEDDMYTGKALLIDKCFALVVKSNYSEIVEEENIYNALNDLKKKCEKAGITEIYMPRICAGHEHVEWSTVRAMIDDIFEFSDTDVIIYSFGKDFAEPVGISNERKAVLYNGLLSHLVNLYNENALYQTLVTAGFTDDEIAYEGLMPSDLYDYDSELDCDCDCGCCNCDCDDEDSANDADEDTYLAHQGSIV